MGITAAAAAPWFLSGEARGGGHREVNLPSSLHFEVNPGGVLSILQPLSAGPVLGACVGDGMNTRQTVAYVLSQCT